VSLLPTPVPRLRSVPPPRTPTNSPSSANVRLAFAPSARRPGSVPSRSPRRFSPMISSTHSPRTFRGPSEQFSSSCF